MAGITLNLSNDYTGATAAGFIVPLMVGNPTMEGEHIMIDANWNGTRKMPIIDMDEDVFAESQMNFQDTVTADISDRELSPKLYDIGMTLPYDVIRQLTVDTASRGAYMDIIDQYEDPWIRQIMEVLAKRVSGNTEKLFWNAVSGSANALSDGIITKLLADANIIPLSTPGGAISDANVLETFGNVYKALKNGMNRIYCNEVDARTFRVKMADAKREVVSVPGGKNNEFFYQEIIVVPTTRIPQHRIVASKRENLFIGINSKSDENRLNIIDMGKTTGDKKVRVAGTISLDFNYAVSADMLLMKP